MEQLEPMVEAIEKEEREATPEAEDDVIEARIERSLIIELKGRLFIQGKEVGLVFVALGDPFDFASLRIVKLKKMFRDDKRRAIDEGIEDACMSEQGDPIYAKTGKPYLGKRYNATVYILNLTTNKFESYVTFGEYADPKKMRTLVPFTKKYKGYISEDGKQFLTVSDSEPYDDVKGLIKRLTDEKGVKVTEIEKYFNKFTKNGSTRFDNNDFAFVIGDVIQYASDKKFFIDDISAQTDGPVAAFNNSATDMNIYKRAKVGLIVTIAKAKDNKLSLQCFGAYTFSVDEGGTPAPKVEKHDAVKEVPDEEVQDKIVTILLQEKRIKETALYDRIDADVKVVKTSLASLESQKLIKREDEDIVIVE